MVRVNNQIKSLDSQHNFLKYIGLKTTLRAKGMFYNFICFKNVNDITISFDFDHFVTVLIEKFT